MSKRKSPAKARVEIVWPKNGAIARPFETDLDQWLAKGWQRVTPEIEPEKPSDDTPDQDAVGD